MLGRAAAWSLGVPAVIHTVHGAPFHPWQGRGARWFFQACERWAARRCHAMVSVADAMTELMVSAGVAPREKFTTIYSGMEVEPFLHSGEHRERVRRELGYGPEHVVIGKIARLFKLKGHDDVIRAARSGRSSAEPNVRFLFVGDGVLRDRLERQIAAAGLSRPFPIHRPGAAGANPGADRRDGHRGPCQPARGACPGAAAGADRRQAGGELRRRRGAGSGDPRRNGLSGSAARRRTACRRPQALAADPALRDRLGQEGRRRFTDVFRHERITAQLRQLYQDVLDRKK